MKAETLSEKLDPERKETVLGSMFAKTRRAFVFAAVFSFAINMLMLALPIYSLQVLDRVISSGSVETLLMLTFIVVTAIAFYGLFGVLRTYILSGVCDWLDYVLAPRLLADAVAKSSLGTTISASQYQRDLGAIKGFISGGGANNVLDAPWSLVFIFVIYMINPILGLLTVAGLISLILFGVLNEFATRKSIEKAASLSRHSGEMADVAGRNAESIESMGMMKNINSVWTTLHYAGMKASDKGSKRATLIQSISRTLRLILQISVTGVGGYLALKGEITVGGMIASSILVGRALAPFEGAIAIWKSFIAAREAYARLNKNLNMPILMERGTTALPAPTGALSVEQLVFAPPYTDPIIKGISFSLKPGESLGIIGPSGAGKSTLVKLMMGLLRPSRGAVRLDSAETFNWNREDFGQHVGYLSQNVDLFSGSIKDNIARMDVNASDAAVVEAAQKAGAHDFILRMPNGYDTECGDRNRNLSPGQRQRIGLARALYGNPKFVVLDEPNANLDGEGERALAHSMGVMKKLGITLVVVAHRPSIVSMVDTLLVLKDGVIEKLGPRAQIMQQYSEGARKGKRGAPAPQEGGAS